MKRILFIFSVILTLSVFSGNAFDLKSALKAAAGNSSKDSTATGGGLGNLLGGLGNILGVTDVTIADLEGTWNY